MCSEEADLGFLLGLFGQEHRLDVGQHAALSDGHAGQQLVQFLVVPDGELQMTGNYPGLLVVASGVSGQLENFGGEVFHHRGQVDRGAGTYALGIVALTQKSMNPADGKL